MEAPVLDSSGSPDAANASSAEQLAPEVNGLGRVTVMPALWHVKAPPAEYAKIGYRALTKAPASAGYKIEGQSS
jgi:hypothetical protein